MDDTTLTNAVYYPGCASSPAACPRCGHAGETHLDRGTVDHYAKQVCTHCMRFLGWRRWPRDVHGGRLPRPIHLQPPSQEETQP